MTRSKLSIAISAGLLSMGLASSPMTVEARSVWGRIWDRLVIEPSMETAKPSFATRWPLHQPAANGKVVVFINPHHKGELGDRLTALRLTGQGFQKLKSKYDDLHGIDGVYVKRTAQGEVAEIRLVENKVDSARLNPGPPAQMSDAWIRQVCQKMLDSSDAQTAETARLVLDHLDSSKLRRELWHHDLSTGNTTVRSVDSIGQPLAINQRWDDRLVANELNRQCEGARLVCQTP